MNPHLTITDMVERMEVTYNANVRIRDLSLSTDQAINKIAAKRGLPKWELVRLALTEFVENHKDETL